MDKQLRVRLVHMFKIENYCLKIFMEICVDEKVCKNA